MQTGSRSISLSHVNVPKSSQRTFSSRRIDQGLQGAQDALIAFEGYGTNGPMLHASVLKRPGARRSGTWFDRVIIQLQHLFSGGRSRA